MSDKLSERMDQTRRMMLANDERGAGQVDAVLSRLIPEVRALESQVRRYEKALSIAYGYMSNAHIEDRKEVAHTLANLPQPPEG